MRIEIRDGLTVAHRVLYALAALTLGLAAVLVSVGIYWVSWPYGGLEHVTIQMGDAPVVAGGTLGYTIGYCVADGIPVPVTVLRELELQDHLVTYALPMVGYTIEQRCEEKTRIVGVPPYVVPGVYHLHIHTEVEVNRLRSIRQVFQSPDFVVRAQR